MCTYLVNYYSGKTVSFHVKFWSIITWTLNFVITLLVPEDVYETLDPSHNSIPNTMNKIIYNKALQYQQSNNNFNPQQTIQQQKTLSLLGWQYLILYWLVYLLTWTIIPVLQQWQNSGDLQSKDRMKRSLKVNGIFYLYMIIGAVVFLVLLILFDVAGQMGLLTFLKCLATIWGLLLLMGLMGYALAEIPKTLWVNAEPENFINYLYVKITQVDDQLQQTYQQFTKIVGFILYTQKQTTSNKAPISSQHQKQQILRYCQQSLKIIPSQYQDKINHKKYQEFLQKIQYLKDYPIGLESSIEHLRLLKRTIAHCKRLQRSIDYYCKKAILYEDVFKSINKNTNNSQEDKLQMKTIKYMNKNQLDEHLIQQVQIVSVNNNDKNNYNNNNNNNKNNNNNNFKLHTKLFQCKWYHHLWYLSLRKPINRFLSVLIGTLSFLLMISQTQVFLTNQYSILRWLLRIQNYQLLRIVVFLVIAFIMYMVNYSLFRLKISNLYGLYYKDSDGPSLMFATVNFSRVGVVIVLNFFEMMKINSQYEKVMGTVNMGLIGEWVIKGLPGVLWLIVLTHFFNLWGKLMNLLKLNDSFGFNSHQIKNVNNNIRKPHMINKKRIKIQKQFLQKYIQNK